MTNSNTNNSHLSPTPLFLKELIKNTGEYCQPVGDDRFRQEIETKYGVKLGQMNRGRPKKKAG